MNFLLNLNLSFLHLKASAGNFCDIIHPYKLLTSYYMRYDICPSIQIIDIILHEIWQIFEPRSVMYLLLACAYWSIAWHIPLLIPFFNITSISQSVINTSFTSVFHRQVFYANCHANLGATRKCAGTSSYISYICYEGFQIYLLLVFYCSSSQTLFTCLYSASVMSSIAEFSLSLCTLSM